MTISAFHSSSTACAHASQRLRLRLVRRDIIAKGEHPRGQIRGGGGVDVTGRFFNAMDSARIAARRLVELRDEDARAADQCGLRVDIRAVARAARGR